MKDLENNWEHIDELIARCLSGHASANDLVSLAEWRTVSAENEKYYQDVAFIYEATAQVANHIEVDADKAWNKVSKEIQKDSTPVISLQVKKNPVLEFLKIAAVILFVTGVSAVVIIALKGGLQKGHDIEIVATNSPVYEKFPGGSEVTVQPNSSFVPVHNSKTKFIEYKLTGSAKFRIVHYENEQFLIHVGNTIITDIGTVFQINSSPDRDSIIVQVDTGSVSFQLENGLKGLTLKAGEKGFYLKSKTQFIKEDHVANTLGELHFENATLKEISEKINALYDIHIRLGNEHIAYCRMTVNFNHSTPSEMIDIIKQTFSLESKTENNTIILYGKGCE